MTGSPFLPPLPCTHGGGQGWGPSARPARVFREPPAKSGPHPNPPPAYQERGPEQRENRSRRTSAPPNDTSAETDIRFVADDRSRRATDLRRRDPREAGPDRNAAIRSAGIHVMPSKSAAGPYCVPDPLRPGRSGGGPAEEAVARRAVCAGAGFQAAGGRAQGRGHQVRLGEEHELPRHDPRLLGLRARPVRRENAGLRLRLAGRDPVQRAGRLRQPDRQEADAGDHRHLHQPRLLPAQGGRAGQGRQGQAHALQPQRRIRLARRHVRQVPARRDPAGGGQEV